MSDEPQFITKHQFARRCGVSDRTIYNWVRTGIGPRAYDLGPQTVRFRVDEVEAWLATRRRKVTP